jgi:hypothetical protein
LPYLAICHIWRFCDAIFSCKNDQAILVRMVADGGVVGRVMLDRGRPGRGQLDVAPDPFE